ncbi:Phosphoribosyltransferase-like protein [Candidatus Nitrosotenuis uzonensis]|uniref:Phosphoribosyltransferase-like protein n=2 Tax=Candidatus Nitrosotenuis uzonensis TaxID=1407055 RepID=V6AUZ8_9ARCH|nr:Phosphoribosyltransferase-like protein [Candidatus Nitrosotenuis uzonensis]
MEMQYDYKNWDEIEKCVDLLVDKLFKYKGKFTSISTVSRGGLVPARLVADRLDIRRIVVDPEAIQSDSLFVDDIYDTGETFRRMIDRADDPEHLVYATLYARTGKNHPKQLIYAKLTKGNEYLVYPWDRFEHGKIDGTASI